MPKKSQQYWLKKWDGLTGTNEDKVLMLLQKYITNAHTTQAYISTIQHAPFNTPADYSKHKEVQATLSSLESMSHSLEFIMATLKHEINNFKPYTIKYIKPNGALKPDKFYVAFDGIDLDYQVLDPWGFKQCHSLALPDLGIHHPIATITDLKPYQDALFNITSHRRHTRGGYIPEQDALYNLLEVIKLRSGINYYAIEHIVIRDRYLRLGLLNNLESETELEWKQQGSLHQRLEESTSLLEYQHVFTNTALNRKIGSINVQAYMSGKIALSITTENTHTHNQFISALKQTHYPFFPRCFLYSRKLATPLMLNIPAFCYIFDDDNYPDKLLYINEHNERTTIQLSDLTAFLNTFPGISHHEINWLLTAEQLSGLMAYLHNPPTKHVIFETRNATQSYTQYITDISTQSFLDNLIQILISIDPSVELCLNTLRSNIHALKHAKEEHRIQQAISYDINAQSMGHYEKIWNLALYNHQQWSESPNDHSIIQLCQLFAAITRQNPHYHEAQNYLESLNTPKQDAEKYTRDEQLFLTALEEEQKNQPLIDTLYFNLCAHTDLKQKISNIKGDANTLLKFAKQWHEKNTANIPIKPTRRHTGTGYGNAGIAALGIFATPTSTPTSTPTTKPPLAPAMAAK